jgi:hypothetical protein
MSVGVWEGRTGMEVTVLVGGGRVAVDGIAVLVTVIIGWMVGEEVIGRLVRVAKPAGVGEDRLATGDGLGKLHEEMKHPAAKRQIHCTGKHLNRFISLSFFTF